jgi:hypothetical protein
MFADNFFKEFVKILERKIEKEQTSELGDTLLRMVRFKVDFMFSCPFMKF